MAIPNLRPRRKLRRPNLATRRRVEADDTDLDQDRREEPSEPPKTNPDPSDRLGTLQRRLQSIEEDIALARSKESFTAVGSMQKEAAHLEKEIANLYDADRAASEKKQEPETEEEIEARILESCEEMSDWHLKMIAEFWLEKHNLVAHPADLDADNADS
jgi:hypothetical protein